MRKSTQFFITLAAVVLCGAFLTGCSARARMARHQARADKYFADGDYSKAEVEYLISLRLDNNNAHALGRLGDIYYEQGRYRRAYAYVEKATQLATNDINLHVKLGTIYIIAHKPKEAKSEADFILEHSPTNSEAPDILAESVTSKTELADVRQRLEKLSKQIGDTAPLQLAFALLDFDSGDLKSTETALQRSLALDPKYGIAYFTLGSLYVAQNKLKEADAAYQKAAELAPIRSPRRLAYANFKIQTGDLDEGKRLMAQITKEAPDYIPAWIRSAEIALAEKRFQDCDSLLDHALARDTDNYDALLLRGRSLLAQNLLDKAVAQFDRMAALYDASPEVHYYLAVSHIGVSDPVKAMADLNKALFLRPEFPEATVLLAGLNISKGDNTVAIASLTQLIRKNPRMGQAYMLLANAYTSQKSLDQALDTYAKLADLYPKNPQVPLLTGMVFAQKKDIPAARKQFEKALELSPKFVLALEQLVSLDINESKFTEALDLVNSKTDEQLGSGRELLLAKVHMARAQNLARKDPKENLTDVKLNVPAARDEVNQCEAALNKVIQMAPDSQAAYFLLAQLYVASGKQQAALDRLNGLVAKTNNAAAYLQIGSLYDTMKDYSKARDVYEKVIATQPDSASALNNLSYIYAVRLGDLDKGYTLADKAHQLSPHDPASCDTLGWILYKKGDYAHARPLLEESVSKMADQAEVQYHAGMVRYMLGSEDSARVALQQAASSSVDFPGKDEAARRLAILAVDPKTADAKTRADFEKRLEDDPNDPVVASRLAGMYERDGALDKAAKTYEQTLKVNPQNAQIMSSLVRVYIGLNESDKALEMGKDAHKLAPNDADLSAMLGRLVFQSGDYTRAASLLQDAASALPNQPDVQYDLAWSYYSVGRVSDAEQTMQRTAPALTGARQTDAKQFLALVAAAKTPATATAAGAQATQILGTNANYVPAIMVAAIQADQQGKPDDAGKLYEQALARYPAYTPAARNLAVLYAKHPGDNQNVYDLGVKARAVYSDDVELERALGVLAYRRGDYARAAQFLQEVSQTQANDGELFYYLGMAQYQLKHLPQSKVALQRALTLNPPSKLADDAKKTLAELK